ncbi:MAG TPA: MurR/RpiR family transcriptional regulator [Thermoclostridium sp.]|nr:MurR/RpiR family transcriptional regulator [Clostridiaceae bacterium]HOQ76420.1 MurR/RpiR family transcriptional regulator [Thermoclostridium sp.]HPU45112.1 MurR/RpiR family transcriptional regulator [Thermoclostridium sp.]
MNDLINTIKEGYPSFSKGQKLIASYIIEHYDKAAFMTAARLGNEVGVSESTVVRFATELGFDGYPRLQKALREIIKSKLTSAQRLEVSSSHIDVNNVMKSVIQSDINKLRATLEEVDEESFNAAVDAILHAHRIYILGVRSSAALASFLGFYLNLIFENVRLVHTTSVSEMFEQIVNARTGDVVIGISFPRYSRRTSKALEFVSKQGATVVAITDNYASPIAKYADYTLFARSDMVSFVDSLVAPLSLINALIVAIGLKRKEQIHATLEKLETIWEEYQIYESDDLSTALNRD